MAEACYGLGDKARFETLMADAREEAPEPWMVETTSEQISKLDDLLTRRAASA